MILLAFLCSAAACLGCYLGMPNQTRVVVVHRTRLSVMTALALLAAATLWVRELGVGAGLVAWLVCFMLCAIALPALFAIWPQPAGAR